LYWLAIGKERSGSPATPAETGAARGAEATLRVWPPGASRGLIDDRNLGRILKVLVAEKASAQQRHAQQVDNALSVSMGFVSPGFGGTNCERINS
jgi:hypothetical protein